MLPPRKKFFAIHVKKMRETLFLVILAAILVALVVKSQRLFQEGAECPAIVSPCIIPDMLDSLTKKIMHQQTLIQKYTKEISDIESRYPLTFQIADGSAAATSSLMTIASAAAADTSSSSKKTKTITSAATVPSVQGKLPYPKLFFVFEPPQEGKKGNRGPQGPPGLQPLPLPTDGATGPPGYYGRPK